MYTSKYCKALKRALYKTNLKDEYKNAIADMVRFYEMHGIKQYKLEDEAKDNIKRNEEKNYG